MNKLEIEIGTNLALEEMQRDEEVERIAQSIIDGSYFGQLPDDGKIWHRVYEIEEGVK